MASNFAVEIFIPTIVGKAYNFWPQQMYGVKKTLWVLEQADIDIRARQLDGVSF